VKHKQNNVTIIQINNKTVWTCVLERLERISPVDNGEVKHLQKSEHGDITKRKVINKSAKMQDNLCYSTSFRHSILILDGPAVICIPDVSWSWLHRSRTASTQHKSSLHQQDTAVYLLLPVVMEMLGLLQGSYQYAVSFSSEMCVC